ncbi:MAG: efflux RND transporter permease subunit [Planctomycetota bacterium]
MSQGILSRIASTIHNDRRLVVLLLALIVVAGLSSLTILPRMEDPILVRRVAMINTRLTGADAVRVESQVTEIIEDRLREIEEIKEVRSVSRVGLSTIVVELLDAVTDSDPVWSRVRSRVDDAAADLPQQASKSTFEELEVRAHALIVGLYLSEEESNETDFFAEESLDSIRLLRRLAVDLQDQLQNVPGTETVARFADPGEEIEVIIDPVRSSSLGISVETVGAQLAAYDAEEAAGQIRDGASRLLVEAGNQVDQIDQIRRLPVLDTAQQRVLLDQIAEVAINVPNPPPRFAIIEGQPAVAVGAMVRPGVRIDQWTQRIETLIEEFQASLPANVAMRTILKQNDYVADRLQSLTTNLILGAFAVTCVIVLLMGWRSAVLVTMTLPLACLTVLFVLRVLEIPIHQMSITGLIIALGLLIDNAIVVVDEVRGRLAKGDDAQTAMVGSVTHLAVPLLGSTLTTALAFAPIALMPGPAGEFVGSIAVSVVAAIVASLFLSLTVIATISARTLAKVASPEQTAVPSRHAPSMERHLRWLRDGISTPRLARGFERVVRQCIRRPVLGIAISVAVPLLGFGLAPTLREQFFPPSGRNQFHVTVEGPAVSSIRVTQRTASEVDAIARAGGEVERIEWFFGDSAPQFYYNVISNRRGTDNFAQGLVTLKPGIDPTPVISRLQHQFNDQIAQARVLARQLEQGPPFEAPVEVRLFGPDPDVLRELGHDVRKRLSAFPEVAAVRTDLGETLPQVTFDFDSRAIGRSGATPAGLARQLSVSLDGMVAGRIHQDTEELPIVVRVGGRDRGDLTRLSSMPVNLTGSDPMGEPSQTPLHAVAKVKLQPQSAAIPRMNWQRMNEVLAYLHAGVLPSVVQTQLEASLAEAPLALPPGYEMRFGGEAAKRDDAVGNLFSTVGVLMTLMAATLVLSFGSFRMAGIIAVVAGLSVGLGMAALVLSGHPFGFMAIIGTMGLIGVAINDSIVVLAGIRANPTAAAGDPSAMTTEVLHSTRHVVATTLTTMAGFAPLIIDGGGFWPPMAICIAGGVAGATLLALILVPSLYRLLMCRRQTPSTA